MDTGDLSTLPGDRQLLLVGRRARLAGRFGPTRPARRAPRHRDGGSSVRGAPRSSARRARRRRRDTHGLSRCRRLGRCPSRVGREDCRSGTGAAGVPGWVARDSRPTAHGRQRDQPQPGHERSVSNRACPAPAQSTRLGGDRDRRPLSRHDGAGNGVEPDARSSDRPSRPDAAGTRGARWLDPRLARVCSCDTAGGDRSDRSRRSRLG